MGKTEAFSAKPSFVDPWNEGEEEQEEEEEEEEDQKELRAIRNRLM